MHPLLVILSIFCFLFNNLSAKITFSNRNARFRVNSGSSVKFNTTMNNWSGTLDQRGIVEGEVAFEDGVLECQKTPAFMNGTYNTSLDQSIRLTGNKLFRLDSGVFAQRIFVSGTGNRLEGQGLLANDTQSAPNLELQNSGASLTLAVQSKLNSYIAMNGGTITLEDDVHFSDDKFFLGMGIVNLNNKRIEFGGSEFNMTSTITYVDATDIELHSNINLSGQVAINGTGPNKIAYLNGHCYTIDLGSTGSILIKDGVTLYLTDICIKNLGDTLGKFIFETSSSSLRLKCVTLQLGDDYTISDGNVFVDGGTEVITGDKFLTFSGTGKLTVDGNTLLYDYLDFEDQNNIVPSIEPSANLDLLNNGLIQPRLRNVVIANSNAIIKKCDEIRHNSDAILAIDTGGGDNALAIANSNLLLVKCKEIENNSNAIVDIDIRLDIVEPIANFAEMLTISNSNLLLVKCQDIEKKSNAIVSVENRVDTNEINISTNTSDISTNATNISTNVTNITNNATDIRHNSDAILNISNNGSALAIANSNLLFVKCQDIENNSNAIVSVENRVDTNETNISTNTSDISTNVTNIANNVTNIATNADGVRANSNLLLVKCQDIKNNSNAIVSIENRVDTNEINISTNTSNISTNATNISTNVTNITNNATDIRHNSDAILNISNNGSDLAIANSNLLLVKCQDIENNSNAIINIMVADSELARANSNLLLVKCAEIDANTTNITNNATDIRHNSDAILNVSQMSVDLIRQNSNAIIKKCDDIENNSNAIINIMVADSELARANSNLLLVKCAEIKNNSDAILSIDIESSDLARHNSNSLLYCCNNNSNAILALDFDASLATNNSNAIVSFKVDLDLPISNSNAIVHNAGHHDTWDHGPGDISLSLRSNIGVQDKKQYFIGQPGPYSQDRTPPMVPSGGSGGVCTVNMTFRIFASQDHKILLGASCTEDCVEINGNGHYIHFARNNPDILVVQEDKKVTLRDIVLKDFSDDVVLFENNSSLTFGTNTVIELGTCETMSMDWTFTGDAIIHGFGNKLDLNDYAIRVLQGATLTIQDVCLENVHTNNIRVIGNSGCIHLKNSQVCLSRDYTFTTGALKIEKEVVITGTTRFVYETCSTSTICSKSTLLLDKGITFEYAPGCDNRDLIYMENETARFFWHGSTIKSTSTGMRLTRGTLIVDGHVDMLNNGAQSVSEGFCFGNGSVTSDLSIVIGPSSTLDLNSGLLSYENIDI